MENYNEDAGRSSINAPAATTRRVHPLKTAVMPPLKSAVARTLSDYDTQKHLLSTIAVPTLTDLAGAWQGSADWASFKWSTRNRYRLELERILAAFGDVPLAVLATSRMKERVLSWRDSRPPRAADEGVQVLRRLVRFGLVHGHMVGDPTAGIKMRWMRPSNAHVSWTEEELSAFQEKATSLGWQQVGWAVRLIAGTGLRPVEAISLRWSDIGKTTITGPSSGAGVREPKERYLIRLPQLDPLLAQLRQSPERKDIEFVLLNRCGRRWHRPLLYAHAKTISEAAEIYHEDTDTGELTLKTFKDLQRTFAVRLMKLTDEGDDSIASLFNWKAEDVATLRSLS